MSKLKVTSLNQLKEYAKGEILELPGWNEEPFVCRVKNVSLLGLASKGKIPNALLGFATEVYKGDKNSKNYNVKDMLKTMDIVAEEMLIEPTIEEIEKAGLELTDEQKYAFLEIAQDGVGALKKFRPDDGGSKNN